VINIIVIEHGAIIENYLCDRREQAELKAMSVCERLVSNWSNKSPLDQIESWLFLGLVVDSKPEEGDDCILLDVNNNPSVLLTLIEA
jgi:hypothetical protein